MQISVQGEQRVRVAPERADLSLAASQEGTDRAKVVADVTAAANEIGRELEAFKAAGVVERYSVQAMRTYAWKKGPHSPERITASVDITARFVDFAALGGYTAEAAARTGVRLGWVNWALTDATADRLRDECIAGAVARARSGRRRWRGRPARGRSRSPRWPTRACWGCPSRGSCSTAGRG